MSEARLRDELRRLAAAQRRPPSFESVMAPARARRRPRLPVVRAAVAGTSLLAALLVVLSPRPDPAPRLAALTLPPTTDWLLETPRATWTPNPRTRRGCSRPSTTSWPPNARSSDCASPPWSTCETSSRRPSAPA